MKDEFGSMQDEKFPACQSYTAGKTMKIANLPQQLSRKCQKRQKYILVLPTLPWYDQFGSSRLLRLLERVPQQEAC